MGTNEINGMVSGYVTEVGESFRVPCFVCHGSSWRLESWHVQPKSKTDPRHVVVRCDCGDGMVWAAEALGQHTHEWVPQAAPDVDNNFQGTLRCKDCSLVIMG